MTARPFLCIASAGVLCNTYREAMDGRLFCFVSCVMLSLGERPGAPKGRPRPAPAPTPWFCEASGEAADREPASLCHSRRETRSVGTGAVEQQLRAKHVSFAASINPERIANQKPNVIVPRPRGCPPNTGFAGTSTETVTEPPRFADVLTETVTETVTETIVITGIFHRAHENVF